MSSPEEIVRQRALAKQREEEDARRHQYQKALTEARILIPHVVEALKKLQYPDDSIFIRNTSLRVNGATRVAWRLHDGSRVNESRLVCYILADGQLVKEDYDGASIMPLETIGCVDKMLPRLRMMADAINPPRKGWLSRIFGN